MSVRACAELVEKGDPERFAATMAAPQAARSLLWPLYALNLELARAPRAAREPVVAEMRLQWWIDTLAELGSGGVRRGQATAEALAPILGRHPALMPLLSGIGEARRRDCWPDPFETQADLEAYLDATSGNLMWSAALALGAPADAETVVRDFAWGAGLAQWFRAVPDLLALGQAPLMDDNPHALARLAREGRARIVRARAQRRRIPATAHPALWTGVTADQVLRRAERDPARIMAGTLSPSEFRRRGALLWRAVAGGF